MKERSRTSGRGNAIAGSLKVMEGQLSLFPEEQKPSGKTKKKREQKNADPSQTYDERRKRFLHYMEYKGMNEQLIETAEGELRTVIDALADYYDIASQKVGTMEIGYPKAAWEIQLEKIKKIQTKLENAVGYSRDAQLETCMKKKPSKNNDIGEDAIALLAHR